MHSLAGLFPALEIAMSLLCSRKATENTLAIVRHLLSVAQLTTAQYMSLSRIARNTPAAVELLHSVRTVDQP